MESMEQDQWNCPICLQKFNTPVVIGCGHTFCKECLKTCKECPLCRFSFESVDKLPINFVVKKFLEQPLVIRSDTPCDNCDNGGIAEVWCLKCEAYYCKLCNIHVHKGKATRGHIRISVNERRNKHTPNSLCEKHESALVYYCLGILLCRVCLEQRHSHEPIFRLMKYRKEVAFEVSWDIYLHYMSITFSDNSVEQGGVKSAQLTQIMLQSDEYIIGLGVRSGTIIDAVTINTNKKEYGPYGGKGGSYKKLSGKELLSISIIPGTHKGLKVVRCIEPQWQE